MLAHIVLITSGYAGADAHATSSRELWDIVVELPRACCWPSPAPRCLVMVAVTSIRRARRRLRYESWHLLHLYAYLGVGLALPHQLWTGQEFMRQPRRHALLVDALDAAAGAVLVCRVGTAGLADPAPPAARSPRSCGRATGVVSVWMTGRHLDRLRVGAGQFFVWRFLTGPGWTRAHPYSLSAAPDRAQLRITVKDLGDGSARSRGLRPGTRVLIEGPYGRLTAASGRGARSPCSPAASASPRCGRCSSELPQGPGDVTLIYRARDERDLVFRAELDALAAARGARVVYVLGRRVPGRATWLPEDAAHLSDEDALRHLVPDIAHHDVYLCGADQWMEAARTAALAAGVPADHIHLERFSW